MSEQTTVSIGTNTDNLFGIPYKVVLFNDDRNEMLSVARQIVKATNCTPEQAVSYMLEAHNSGSAVVFKGSKERCELVDSILSGPPTTLSTSVEPA